ncbi:MAG: hypothetical protein AB8B92_01525 [Gammaproteobacteria bacterium]
MEDDDICEISVKDVLTFSKLFVLMGAVLIVIMMIAPANALPL